MTIETKKYSRRPFDVEAVRVTKTNMEEVAKWCEGTVVNVPASGSAKAEHFIQVAVNTPATERQSRAFPGDYVLLLEGGKSFKVYTTKAFNKNFVLSSEISTSTAAPAKAQTKKGNAQPETPPANGIKPEAREALRKMGEAGQKALETGAAKAKEITESFKPKDDVNTYLEQEVADEVASVTPQPEGKDETPSAPVEAPVPTEAPVDTELPPLPEEVMSTEEREARTQANEVAIQAAQDTEPAEEPKKRKFIQQ